MANQRASSVKTKVKPMYFYVKMNAEFKKLGFAFSKMTLCSALARSLENGMNFKSKYENIH